MAGFPFSIQNGQWCFLTRIVPRAHYTSAMGVLGSPLALAGPPIRDASEPDAGPGGPVTTIHNKD